MNYPLTASIIFVQLDADSDAIAYVAYDRKGDAGFTVRKELKLGTLSDASDMQMWMQMAAASVCDNV